MDVNFAENEHHVLRFWQKNRIFEKSVKMRPKARQFVFYEGPPTANGKPGLHHVLARVFKDIICRYKTMQGFRVERKAGWDTHGLPVELQVEKELGLKSKREIEKYGIAQFNKKCRESVWRYKKDWEGLTERIGYWLDTKEPYITYQADYIETVWWIIRRIWQKGLLYQDYKVVPYCPRCGTSLSSHEVAQGYKKVEDLAPYVMLKLKTQNSKLKTITQNSKLDIYLLTWTTTPWTLPGNVALAVNPKLDYVLAEMNNGMIVLAKNRLDILGADCKIVREFKGGDLAGIEYEPLFDIKELQSDTSHKLYTADFVTDDEGTGIVHTAVMYGVDDYELGKKHNLPQEHTVDKEGKFNDLVRGFEGQPVKAKETEDNLLDYLKAREQLFKQELYEHDYPFCWRCKEPLLYYGNETWFIKMTAEKEQLLANNQKINWLPVHLQKGRFGEWLKEVKDWALSRERYWGTPLPVWLCQTGKAQSSNRKTQNHNSKLKTKKNCDNVRVIGSIKELERLSGSKVKDPHRPHIDGFTFECEKCGGVMKRAPEVIDCWFDSGSMPFAQDRWTRAQCQMSRLKYQDLKEGELKLKPPELFPADYICEAIDQTRGWFYTLLAISTLLGFGPSYKNVISLGHILDEKGEKMSKSRGNVIDPWLVMNKYGADAARWFFFTVNQPGDAKQVSLQDIERTLRKFLMTFYNCYVFFETYSRNTQSEIQNQKLQLKIKNLLDKWIISRLNELILEATEKLDNYDIAGAARDIENFVVDDLSLWYIRRARRRFQNPSGQKELKEAVSALGFILLTMSRLTAPFIPFLSEQIYQNISDSENQAPGNSVHLENWPKADKKLIDRALNQAMEKTRILTGLVLAERAKAGIKVRQPLSGLKVQSLKFKVDKELLELLKEEVNIKEVIFNNQIKKEVELDTEITSELREEGIVKEVIRHIQEMRKETGLKPKDRILARYAGPQDLNNSLKKYEKFILEQGRIKSFAFQGRLKRSFDKEKEIKVGDEKLWLGIKRI